MPKLVVIGSLNMDLIALTPRLPGRGETILGTSYLTVPGGKGANQAYAAAKLGGQVAMLGRVGTDEHGRRMRANLEAVGCDVTGVRETSGPSGIAMILVEESGENVIVVVPGANALYLPADLKGDESQLVGARYALLQLEVPMATVLAAAQAAKRHGAQVILDPAPVPEPLAAEHWVRELLGSVDVLTPNETEAAQLLGHRASADHHPSADHRASALSMDEARDIARRLQGLGPRTVIVKLGSKGCLLADGDSLEAVAAPTLTAVDTTAAGDVFNAAFAVASAEGASKLDACRFAVQAAALSVTRLGAQASMPGRAEVDGRAGQSAERPDAPVQCTAIHSSRAKV
jgi:ribokinase